MTLTGKRVRLEPLGGQHTDALLQVALIPSIWEWSPTPIRNRDDLSLYIERALQGEREGHMLPFATFDLVSNRFVGSTRFGAIDVPNRRVEIGWTWLTPTAQRSHVNTEAKLLMLEHAFERWRCMRVEFKTDALNQKSRAAILRLGAKEEGTLRSHMITAGGRLRDSVYFSILAPEWPAHKARLIQRRDAAK